MFPKWQHNFLNNKEILKKSVKHLLKVCKNCERFIRQLKYENQLLAVFPSRLVPSVKATDHKFFFRRKSNRISKSVEIYWMLGQFGDDTLALSQGYCEVFFPRASLHSHLGALAWSYEFHIEMVYGYKIRPKKLRFLRFNLSACMIHTAQTCLTDLLVPDCAHTLVAQQESDWDRLPFSGSVMIHRAHPESDKVFLLFSIPCILSHVFSLFCPFLWTFS